jgi:hypothetical protein
MLSSKSRNSRSTTTTAPHSDTFVIIALPTRFHLCHLRLSRYMICGHCAKSPMICMLPSSFPAAADYWENRNSLGSLVVVCCHILFLGEIQPLGGHCVLTLVTIHLPIVVYDSSPKTLARSSGKFFMAFRRCLGLSCLCLSSNFVF